MLFRNKNFSIYNICDFSLTWWLSGHMEVCSALLEAGAKVDEADNEGKGALMLAAQEGHTALVEMLLDEWGAPPDQRAHDGKTALR